MATSFRDITGFWGWVLEKSVQKTTVAGVVFVEGQALGQRNDSSAFSP